MMSMFMTRAFHNIKETYFKSSFELDLKEFDEGYGDKGESCSC